MTLRAWTILAIAGVSVACSSSKQAPGTQFHAVNPNAGGEGNNGGAGNGSNGGSIFGNFDSGSTGGLNDMTQCGGEAVAAEREPVDLYIMFDQSSSMAANIPGSTTVTWMQTAQKAIDDFVNDPGAAGMGVGIQYFPQVGAGATSENGDSCDISVYQKPEVDIGLLPGAAGALSNSINAHQPTSFTPTGPAVSGAVARMKAWAPLHPGRAPIVVLVTDGYPTVCQPQQPTDIANNIVGPAFTTDPPVRTFVIGFEDGGGLSNLDTIAKAGGTGKAFRISGGDIGAQFKSALLGIASTPLSCDFDIPKPNDPTMTVDITKIAVDYTPNGGQTAEVPKLQSQDDCALNGGDGWYYDSTVAPKKIIVCPGTCAKFSVGVVNTRIGCAPVEGLQ
jgi:hypothetical protein